MSVRKKKNWEHEKTKSNTMPNNNNKKGQRFFFSLNCVYTITIPRKMFFEYSSASYWSVIIWGFVWNRINNIVPPVMLLLWLFCIYVWQHTQTQKRCWCRAWISKNLKFLGTTWNIWLSLVYVNIINGI